MPRVTRVLPATGGAVLGATGQAIGSPDGSGLVSEHPELQFRATMASDMPMVVADARLPDYPLTWVNPAFERTTGYLSADVVGRNCRFLQGPAPDRQVTGRIAAALHAGVTADEVMLNFRADGSPFWNHVVISPMRDETGLLTHFVGVQTDVTDRVTAEDGRRSALRETGRANSRLRTMASVHRQMDARLRLGKDVLGVLPELLTTEIDGWAVVADVDARGRVRSVSAHHSSPARATLAGALADAVQAAADGTDDGPLARTVQRLLALEPVVVPLDPSQVRRVDDVLPGVFPSGDGAMVVAVPLLSRGALIGLLALARDGEQSFDDDDVAAVGDLGVRVSMALDIAGLYAAEHNAALTLQRSLLPSLPVLDRFDVAARYEPASAGAEIGGDWYDVLDFPRPGIGVAIGDVMGHDIEAAAAMGQLRSVLRSYAWSGDSPAAVIGRLDELVQGLGMAALATCFYATVTPVEGSTDHELVYVSAGHPPPLVKRADGRVERLDAALTSPVGVLTGTGPLVEGRTRLSSGDVVLLYTDGLVETRTRDVLTGIDELTASFVAAPADADARRICDAVAADLLEAQVSEDDTCVLVLRCS